MPAARCDRHAAPRSPSTVLANADQRATGGVQHAVAIAAYVIMVTIVREPSAKEPPCPRNDSAAR